MNKLPLKILVTGVGGDLGQAIIKSVCLMDMPVEIFGCDMDSESIGRAFVDDFFVISSPYDREYLNLLNDYCEKKGIHTVVPGSEAEIYVLSRLGTPLRLPCGTVAVCQEFAWLETFGNKLECFRALDKKVELAPYADGTNDEQVEEFISKEIFPCVVKPRVSSGSKDLKIAQNENQLLAFIREVSNPVVQEYIDDTYGEFSIGVFSTDNFSTAIAFKRKLGPFGATWYAENYDQDQEVLDYAYKIAEVSRLRGSCNIQVRKSNKGVRLLEINPRFSSLVAARAACGFKDLEWSICKALKIRVSKPDFPFRRLTFRRYLHELIDFGEGYIALGEWLPKYSFEKGK
jgi:carbamoyl-phosphate synthase large subunit